MNGWIRIDAGFYLVAVLSNSRWLRLIRYGCMFVQDSNYDKAENIVNVMIRMFIFYAEFKSCKHTTLTKVFFVISMHKSWLRSLLLYFVNNARSKRRAVESFYFQISNPCCDLRCSTRNTNSLREIFFTNPWINAKKQQYRSTSHNWTGKMWNCVLWI